MEVSLPQTMLQKVLDLLKLESFHPHQEIAIQSIIQDQKDAVICTHIDYHNQHERAALIGIFRATSLVLTSVESYRNYRKPDAERSTGVPLLSAAESTHTRDYTRTYYMQYLRILCRSLFTEGKINFTLILTNYDGLGNILTLFEAPPIGSFREEIKNMKKCNMP